MKRFIGIIILIAVFALLFIGTAWSIGWLNAAIVWVLSIVLTGIIVGAVYLIVKN